MSKISFLHVNLGGLRYRKNDSLKIKIHYLFLSFLFRYLLESIRLFKENYEFTRFDLDENVTFTFSSEKLDFEEKKKSPLLVVHEGRKEKRRRIEACRPERVSWRKNRISRSPSNFIRRSIDRSTCTRLSFHFLPSNYAIIALISDNRQLSCIQRLVSAVDKQDCSLFPPQPV